MMRKHIIMLCGLWCISTALARSQPPVLWTFSAKQISTGEARISMVARIDAGWHLYSQHLDPGGPIPTKFTFTPSESYVPSGPTLEKGNRETHYDNLYEMDVTTYSGSVAFEQVFFVRELPALLRGSVTYMACNDVLCIPGDQEFAVEINPKP